MEQPLNPSDPPFASPEVADAFAEFPEAVRGPLLRLRALIFEVAEATPGVGALEEGLKWGQPSYATAETGAGSPVRLGCPKSGGGFGIYVHCATRIIPDFEALYPDFRFDGTRGVVFEEGDEPSPDALGMLIASALTYHLRKKHNGG
ncbi:DUF1801 domain-containing protein [Oceanicola sp. D3]|uniref:DUF1801 domain-containing protein n=1 Tax=Oceanicola sp. D3 TaxID=2587163 RepID=UPI00112289BC|nr:DUF1801 domain-containing protein [Oceanicola sp. D3]QDC10839.1 DUF1801 domain-containing protein [Oceanicola sp. D3]